jgi:translation initiation factor 2A
MASFQNASTLDLPRTRLVVREKQGITLYEGPLESNDTFSMNALPAPLTLSLRIAPVYDTNGAFVCIVPEREYPFVINVATGERMFEIAISDVQRVDFSPASHFLITWSLPTKGTATESSNNLKVWNISSGAMVAAFSYKTFRNDLIQWALADTLCFRQVSNEVHVFNSENISPGSVVAKVIHHGYTQYKICKVESEDKINFALFNPEAGGKPARVTLFQLNSLTFTVDGPLNSRTIFGATEALLMWNKQGVALLIHSQSDIDNSSASYYGATGLYLIHTKSELSIKVEQTKEGPVHACEWSPEGDKFAIAAGTMPSQSTLYNDRGEPLFQFGAAHRNVVSWAPHGRFLCLAGFGNLAGEMDFYDVLRLKKLGSNVSHCATTYQWSPDSRFFMTASLAPRMNVDNCFKIFKYNGVGPICQHNFDEKAYASYWKPIPHTIYPNRGPSPLKRAADGTPAPAAVPVKAAIPVAAPYRPPGSTGELSKLMSRSGSNEAPVGKVKKEGAAESKYVPAAQKQRVIPGMAPPTGPPAGNKKKPQPAAKPAAPSSTLETKSESKQIPTKPADPVQTVMVAESVESKEKRQKALQKKLKQIHEIKSKLAAGLTVEPEQVIVFSPS